LPGVKFLIKIVYNNHIIISTNEKYMHSEKSFEKKEVISGTVLELSITND